MSLQVITYMKKLIKYMETGRDGGMVDDYCH